MQLITDVPQYSYIQSLLYPHILFSTPFAKASTSVLPSRWAARVHTSTKRRMENLVHNDHMVYQRGWWTPSKSPTTVLIAATLPQRHT